MPTIPRNPSTLTHSVSSTLKGLEGNNDWCFYIVKHESDPPEADEVAERYGLELVDGFARLADQLPELHKNIGRDYVDKIIVPAIRSEVRAVIGKYTVESVYSKNRQEIETKIEENLKGIFERNFIVMQDVLIRNTRFSEEYQKAIEAKQVALQEAERMQYVLQKQRQEKERKIVEAEGEAQSIRIKGQALSANPRLIQYEYVQKIAPGIKAVIADQKTIMNFSNLFDSEPAK